MHASIESRVRSIECNFKYIADALAQVATVLEVIMIDTSTLEAKIAELEAAETAREERDTKQDAVTFAQITALEQAVKDLQVVIDGGNSSPEDQAKIDAASGRIGAVITSLDAADPTPPIV